MARQANRWSEAQAEKILDRADRAKSDRRYADARGINAPRLTWWRTRLGRPRRAPKKSAGSNRARSSKPVFVEVTAPQATPAAVVEILLTNGRQLRVSAGLDPMLVGELANALEDRC